jgi:hypothetical protein
MKKKLLVAFSILLVLCMVAGTLKAGLYCYQLKDCSGGAGCAWGGNLNGCTITCTGGGQAECDSLPI